MKRFFMLLLAASAIVLQSCSKTGPILPPEDGMYDRVVILYAAGFNSLSSDIKNNISDATGKTPNTNLPTGDSSDVLLVVSHNSVTDANFTTMTNPYVVRLTRDFVGRPVADTLRTLSTDISLMDKDSMHEILSWIKSEFPSRHYGMILSSHGTGWLPQGYYADPSRFDKNSISTFSLDAPASSIPEGASPVSGRLDQLRNAPKVKSFGEERRRSGSTTYAYEMDICDLAAAIPMHLDYMVFDACLMGGVEVAYELRNVTDHLCFCPTEVLSGGFDYAKLVSRLVGPGETNLIELCRDYYWKYAESSTPFVTITCLDTSCMEDLAMICKDLFAKYRVAINHLSGYSVQGYYRMSRHYFYDFLDILEKAGANESELISLREVLRRGIPFMAFTPNFIEIQINKSCGLSMYLPSQGSEYLDNYYRNLAWNKATGLVE